MEEICDNQDRLISFNNEMISYDEMGRPLIYRNKKLTWNNQNQLLRINNDINYIYDVNGIRSYKLVKGIETRYITQNNQIICEENNNGIIIYQYILNKLIGFTYTTSSGTKKYLYIRNIQGDITSIIDSEGNKVCSYIYDGYGNHIVLNQYDKVEEDPLSIGHINPFRYRGYYFDEESGLYYLNSRYYDPETGRFISPDVLSILDETKGQINGLNLYMYCNDNPIMYTDDSGCLPEWLKWVSIGAAILGAALVVSAITVLTCGIGTTVLAGTVVGAGLHSAAIGALIGAGVGTVAGGLIGGAVSNWSLEGIAIGIGIGLGVGALVGAIIGGVYGTMSAKVHSVYISKSNGTFNYVGRTNNIARRTAEHALNGKGVVPQEVANKLSLRQARGLEQALIEKYGMIKNGGTLINKINSIASSNPIYEKAVKWGFNFIKKFLMNI